MRRHPIAAALSLALLALAAPAAAAPPAARAPKATPDRELGLSKGSVLDTPAPPAYRAEDSAPGEKRLPRRLSREIPPVIPHGVADFLPITREENGCLTCHELPGPKKRGEPTPIPASHYQDLRRAPGQRQPKLYGARYVCVSCHVPRSDARPLVQSRFQP